MFPEIRERELGVIIWLLAVVATSLAIGWLKMADLSCLEFTWLFPCAGFLP